jgi:hypothetical protein
LKILFISYNLAGVIVVLTFLLGLPSSPSPLRLFLRFLSLSLLLFGLAMRLYCSIRFNRLSSLISSSISDSSYMVVVSIILRVYI